MQRSKNLQNWRLLQLIKKWIGIPDKIPSKIALVTLLAFSVHGTSFSQACSIGGPSGGVVADLVLDGTGMASVNYGWLNSAGIVINDCPLFGRRYRLFQGATQFGPDLQLLSGTVDFDCTAGTQGVGQYILTVWADDNADPTDGQIGPINLTINVLDTDPPTVNCPAAPSTTNTSVNGTGDCGTTIPGLNHATVADNCSGSTLTVTYTNGASVTGPISVTAGAANNFIFQGGTTVVSYSAADASGNTSSPCSFNVVITDDEDPSWDDMSTVVSSNIGTHAVLRNVTNADGRRNFHIGLECSSSSLTADLNYFLNTFIPTGTDNCMGTVTVSEQNRNDVTFATCGTVNSYTNVMREIIIRYEGTDASGNALDAAAPDDRFVLKVYVRNTVAPEWTDNMPFAFAGQTGPNYSFTQTYNTGETWNPTASANACQVDFGAAGAPDLSVMASDCASGSTSYAWTITPGAIVSTPSTLSGTSQNAFIEPFEAGTYTIVYTATDFCGNSSTYSVNLTIADNSGPAITGQIAGPLTGNTSPGNCEATVQWTNPEATDCSGPMPIIVSATGVHAGSGSTVLIDLNAGPDGSGGILAQADFPIGTTEVTYTFTDALLNSSTESFLVIITDNEAPTISCGGPVVLPTVCGAATIPDFTGNGTASDNCPASLSITQFPLPNASVSLQDIIDDFNNNGSVAPYFYQDNDADNLLSDGDEFTITLTPNDGTQSGSPCNIQVALQNNAAPVPTMSPLPVIDNTFYVGAGCGSIDIPAPTAQDCNGVIYHGTPGFATGNPSLNIYTFATGVYTVTWTYFDGVNISTQLQNITVVDDSQSPSLEIPGDLTMESTDFNLCTKAINIGLVDVSGSPLDPGPYNPIVNVGEYKDNCGIVSATYELTGATTLGPANITPTTSVNLEKGTTTITYTISDGINPDVVKSRMIAVEDNQAPTPFVPQIIFDISVSSVFDAVADDCSFTVNTSSQDPTATDNCDLTGATVTKTIVSVVPWSGTPNATWTLASNSTLNGAVFSPSAMDNNNAWYFITWEFEDVDGNDIQQGNWIRVFDLQPATFDCVPDEDGNALNGIQVERGTGDDGLFGDCYYTVQGTEFDLSNVFDNCEIDTIQNSLNGKPTLDGYVFGMGSHSIIWTVWDLRGNSSFCTVDVEITDNEEPTFSCISGQVFTLNSSGTVSITAAQLANPFSWSDNCSGAPFQNPTISQSVFTCADTGNNIDVTVTYEDANGNINSCVATVTIQENIPPVAMCADITIQLDAAGDASITDSDLDDGSFDACGGSVTFQAMQTAFDCDDLGTNSILLTVSDNNNNTATCTSQVTVEDNIDPVAICQPVTAYLDASGNVVVTAAQVNDGSSDNTDSCWPVDLKISGTAGGALLNQMSFSCSNVGSVDVWLTVTDNQGLTDQCMTTITVVDNVMPTASCLNPTYRLGATGTVEVFADDLDGGSTDNCGSPSSLSFNIGGAPSVILDCTNIGLNDVVLTVVDQNGNMNTCTATVEILPEDDVILEIGMVTGGAGQIIDVPVTVSNGEDLRSFQFTVEIDDPTVGVINGFSTTLSDFTTNLIGNNVFAFAWSPLGTTGTTFNDGDTVLTLHVELVGLDNEMSAVNFISTPTPLVISQGCGVLPYGTAVSGTAGSIFIDPNTTVTISGTIMGEDGDLQENVLVSMTGDESGSTTTDANGEYSFTIPNNSIVTLTPSSNATPIRGVDAVDLAFLVSEFINGGGVINSPYDLIGGNVIPDGIPGIQIADVSRARQEIVSLTPTWMPQFNSFRYVNSDYIFTNPTAPWAEVFEENRSLTATGNMTNLDFISVKMGDVNDSWVPLTDNDDPINRNAGTTLILEDVSVKQGETAQVRFSAKDFDKLIAFQSTFSFDNSVFDIIDATPIGLVNFEKEMISLQYADLGLATIIWYNHQAITLEPKDVVFEFTIQAKKDITSLEGLIDFSEEVVKPKVYDDQAIAYAFDLEFEATTVSTDNPVIDNFNLFQNAPNPFVNTTNIAFTLPASQYASLSISDATGRVLWLKDGVFNKGLNQVSLTASDLAYSGVLFIKLESEGQSKTKRMILLNN